MEISRRHLAMLLPAIAAAQSAPQSKTLPSRTLRFEDLPVKQNGPNASRAMLNGETHSGFAVEVHQSELAPGEQPHAPHKHVHEEMVLVWEGTLEFTMNGVTSRLGPGSAAYAASMDEHGFRNVGGTRARYFVVAFGKD
jgi:uncharacterized cupin superfamily protein